MAAKNSKQFGVWMDSRHATVLSRDHISEGSFIITGRIKNEGPGGNSSEKASNHLEITLMHKFFKEITALMQNADEVYVTGTGDAQEQFIKYLSETPQFKNTKSSIDTSNQMADDKLIERVGAHFDDAVAR